MDIEIDKELGSDDGELDQGYQPNDYGSVETELTKVIGTDKIVSNQLDYDVYEHEQELNDDKPEKLEMIKKMTKDRKSRSQHLDQISQKT